MRTDIARRARCAVALALVAGALGCASVLGPSPAEGDWLATDSARFTLYTRPDSFAAQNVNTIAGWLEGQYTFTTQVLQSPTGGRVSGFLYESAADADREFSRSGTAYFETGAFKAVCDAPLDASLFGLVAHEANHVILWYGLGRPGTTFVTEGLPSAVIDERIYPAGRTEADAWVARNFASVPPITDLIDDDRFSAYPTEVSYNASASFLAYLIATYGPTRLKQIHGATPSSFARRFEEAYGRPVASLDAEWRQAIAGGGGLARSTR